ncbi:MULTISPECIES: type II toxin-antitoxin system PemK/MazF family toxin [unclassified Microcoleus]|uniref:type II toxin-antitoxin system PemK/MazF family toxin n=1 Tax=unclassified Microcoleus TaxID=2642155 RepID=UPI002FD43C1B
MRRGEVYDADFEPVQGSEQGGTRPAIIVSNDAINASSQVVLVVPCTTYRPPRRIYRSQVLIIAPDGGFDRDSIALGEQVRALAKSRLLRKRGTLSESTVVQLDSALSIALDLSNQ